MMILLKGIKLLVLFLIEGNLKRFVVYHILPPNFHTGNPNGI